MSAILFVLAAIAAVVSFLLRQKAAVLPPGQVVYSDTNRRAITADHLAPAPADRET